MKTITTTIKLNKSEKALYDTLLGFNNGLISIAKQVKSFLDTGVEGQKSLVNVAIEMKANNQPTGAFKIAVQRYFSTYPKGQKLSLQGLGNKGKPVIKAISNSGGSDKAGKEKLKDINDKAGKVITTTNDSAVTLYISKMNEDDRGQFIWDLVADFMPIGMQLALANNIKETIKKTAKK